MLACDWLIGWLAAEALCTAAAAASCLLKKRSLLNESERCVMSSQLLVVDWRHLQTHLNITLRMLLPLTQGSGVKGQVRRSINYHQCQFKKGNSLLCYSVRLSVFGSHRRYYNTYKLFASSCLKSHTPPHNPVIFLDSVWRFHHLCPLRINSRSKVCTWRFAKQDRTLTKIFSSTDVSTAAKL